MLDIKGQLAIIGENQEYAITTCGEAYSLKWGKIRLLRQTPNAQGYMQISLCEGSRCISRRIHRLMAETFLGPKPFDDAQVRHLDGNQINNNIDNLAWGTAKDNCMDRDSSGKGLKGKPRVRLSEANVQAMRADYADDMTYSDLAKKYGVSVSTVWKTVKNITHNA